MKKKLLTREVKVGIMATVAIFVLYFGINFLKGVIIFSPVNYYYATYDNIGGLVPSAPVFIKGYKVGQVEEIKYDFKKETSFVVKISVSRDIQLPMGAKIELFDDGLMGGKAIQLVFGSESSYSQVYVSGDTLQSQVGMGLMAQFTGQLMPKVESITNQTDSLLRSLRSVVDGNELRNSMKSIEKTTSELSEASSQLKKIMNKDVPLVLGDVNHITSDLKAVTGNIRKVDFAATFSSINHTIENLNFITDKMKGTDGTIGLLLNNKDLYTNLNSTASNADKLVLDLKENPKRYVHFSLFGSK